jgi:hypothetical protein
VGAKLKRKKKKKKKRLLERELIFGGFPYKKFISFGTLEAYT